MANNNNGCSLPVLLILIVIESVGKLGWYIYHNGWGCYKGFYIDADTWFGNLFLTIDLWIAYVTALGILLISLLFLISLFSRD